MSCGKISSGYSDLRDLDGTLRDRPHTGIDLGEIGDTVIAPAHGRILAIWSVDHGWGRDWNLLILHKATDLNLPETGHVYLSEFNHLQRRDMPHLYVGEELQRGRPIGRVRHPGDNRKFRGEVHLEVYKLSESRLSETRWLKEKGLRYWWNGDAELIDPLWMLTRNNAETGVVALFDPETQDRRFSGFVYPLLCLENEP